MAKGDIRHPTRGLEMHHRRPFSLGGTHTAENLLLLCPDCHHEPEGYGYTEGIRRAGRPPGRDYQIRRTLKMRAADDRTARALAQRWDCPVSEAIRRAVRDAARREGLEKES